MEKLLHDLNLDQEEEWEAISRFKSKRKASFQDAQPQFMKFVEYKESENVDDEGFVTIESNNRIQKLRALRQKPLITLQTSADNSKKVKYAATTGGVKQSKMAKIKAAMQVKAQGKVRFATVGEVKAEWLELEEFNYASTTKTAIEHTMQVLSEPEFVPHFNQSLTNIKSKKPVPLQVKNANQYDPGSLLKNKTLTDLWDKEVIPEGQFGLFMQENTLLSFASIIKREFPFNVSIIKKHNKFAFISDFSHNNSFSVLHSFNENSQKPWSEKEEEVVQISLENTLIEDNFFYNVCQEAPQPDAQLRYFKLTLAGKYHIYSCSRVDLLNSKGEPMLARSLFEDDRHWQNLDNRLEELTTIAIQNNGVRAFEWIFSSFLTNAKQIVLGVTARQLPNKVDSHFIYRVMTKKFEELTRLYNLRHENLLAILVNVFKPITEIKGDGNYAVHKVAYKPNIKIFQEGKSAN
jgi:hypothetical protein